MIRDISSGDECWKASEGNRCNDQTEDVRVHTIDDVAVELRDCEKTINEGAIEAVRRS